MTEPRRRVYLLDGLALAYRSHFAFIRRPLTNTKGENTSAVFAFANTVMKLRDERKPDAWALAWDSDQPTRRHGRYAEYKAHRPPMPDDLYAQLPKIQELARAIGLPIVEFPGAEADDVMATFARRAEREGFDAVLVTNDKDLMQLVNEHVAVLAPGGGKNEDAWLDVDAVRAKWGVEPAQLRDVLALMGDSSDNVPGVPGVGEKTAVELIGRFGSLASLYERLAEVPRESLRAKLAAHKEAAFLSLELVTVDDDLPLVETWEDLALQPIDAPRLREIAEELDLRRLLRYIEEQVAAGAVRSTAARRGSLAAPGPEAVPPLDPFGQLGLELGLADDAAAAPVAVEGPREPFGPPVRIVTDAAELRALRDALLASEGFVLDTETTAEDPLRARVVGVGVSYGEAPVYLPLAHRGGTNLPREAFEEVLGPILADPAVPKIGQHFKYDQLVLRGEGVPVAGLAHDTMIASYLLDPESPNNLDWLAARHLGVTKIPTSALLGKRGKELRAMDELPVDLVAGYCGEDVHVTWLLAARFAPALAERGLEALFKEVEVPLSDVLSDMEWEGVAVDVPFLGAMSRRLGEEIAGLEKRIYNVAGTEFNVQSTQQLGEVLFQRLGLPGGRRTKTGWSTDSDVLEGLAEKHDLPRLVLQYRQLTKLKSTYVDALPLLVHPKTGRVHTSFHQTVAATGRLSSSDPNLQNIPFRTPLGREVRRAFVPRPGWKLVSADYSQIELRIMAHLSGDEALTAAFRAGEDVHASTASRVFGLAEGVRPAPEQRAMAKVVNFGIMYGMGARSLASQLGMPVADATRFIADYFQTHQGVEHYLKGVVDDARGSGFVETMLGRKRWLPGLALSDGRERANAERAAINTPLQGSAADLIKVAMIRLARDLEARAANARLVLQVHDELLLECPADEVDATKRAVSEAMTEAMPLRVPLEVQLGVGDSWFEVHA
jgi:DNA polymerase-1